LPTVEISCVLVGRKRTQVTAQPRTNYVVDNIEWFLFEPFPILDDK